jgi:hypothetical protein
MRVMNDAYRRGQFGLLHLGMGYVMRMSKLVVPLFFYRLIDQHILRRQ